MAMKKCIYLLLSFFCGVVHANSNVIILNDVSEYGQFKYGALSRDLSKALLEGENPILCTKALLHNIFFHYNFYEDLVVHDLEYNSSLYYPIFEKISSPEDIQGNIDIFKSNIMIANQYLMDIQEYVKSSSAPLLDAIQEAINKYKSSLQSSSESWKSLESKNLVYLFQSSVTAFFTYENIDFDQYNCKEVNEDFILFIPKKLQTEAFNYEQLNEYSLDSEVKALQIDDSTVSEKLLEALTIICKGDKKYEWNIIFSGHGSPLDRIAGMTTVSESNADSVFMKCLNFFRDKVNTQNVVIISCYPGGEKIKSTFTIDSEFNNAQLARLNYTLIFAGSQPTTVAVANLQEFIPRYRYFTSKNIVKSVVAGTRDICYVDLSSFWSAIFKALDDKKYGTVGDSLGKSYDGSLELNKIMLIKLPHQEWMQPVAFTNDVEKLSQIQAFTASKPIVYSDKTKFLLTAANYVPATVTFSGSSLPVVLPTTHLNYNFYFEKIITPLCSPDSDSEAIKSPVVSKNVGINSYLDLLKKSLGHFLKGDLEEPVYFYINNVDNHDDCSVLVRIHSTLDVSLIYWDNKTIESFSIDAVGAITSEESDFKKELQRVEEVIERATNQTLMLLEGIQKIDSVLQNRNSNPNSNQIFENTEFDPIFTNPELVPVDSGLLNSLAKQDTTLIKGSVIEIENASGVHSLENESVAEDSNLEVDGAFVATDYTLIPLDSEVDQLPEEEQGCVKNVLLKLKQYLSSWI